MSGEHEGSSRAGGRRFSAAARELLGGLPGADQAGYLDALQHIRHLGGARRFRRARRRGRR